MSDVGRIVFGPPYTPMQVEVRDGAYVAHSQPLTPERRQIIDDWAARLLQPPEPRQPTEAEIAAGRDMVELADWALARSENVGAALNVRRIGLKLQGISDE
jgi:hypothetical protein